MRKNIKLVIDEIRKKPAMYLGCLSITRLGMFLRGYSSAIDDITDSNDHYLLMKQFTDWLATHYSITMSLAWDGILLKITGSEESAFSLFEKKWDEFLTESKHDALVQNF